MRVFRKYLLLILLIAGVLQPDLASGRSRGRYFRHLQDSLVQQLDSLARPDSLAANDSLPALDSAALAEKAAEARLQQLRDSLDRIYWGELDTVTLPRLDTLIEEYFDSLINIVGLPDSADIRRAKRRNVTMCVVPVALFEFGEHLDHLTETVGLGRGDLREFEEERAHFEVGPVGDAARLERLAVTVAEHPLERLHAVEEPAHVARSDDDPFGRNREGVALDRLRHPFLREFEAAERLAVLRRHDRAARHRLLVDAGERQKIELLRRGDGEFGGKRETPFRRFEFLRLRDDQRIAVAGPSDRGHVGEERDGERQRQQHQHSFQHGK